MPNAVICDRAYQANWLLLTDLSEMVLPMLAHLKVHYRVLGTWVHIILLHLFVTADDTFTFIYVFIYIQKVKGHTRLKTLSST